MTVRNQGSAAAGAFWVDLYINPSHQPEFNITWNATCSLNPCFGIAWAVARSLAPGERIALTSVVSEVAPSYSRWLGYFAAGTTDVYVLADSWNPSGSMADANRANNLAHIAGLRVTGPNPALTGPQSPAVWPARPAAQDEARR